MESNNSEMEMENNRSGVDEELECRVCRGEAEEGRPLYAPCLCSGSIMYTHQDCLSQWLEHSGKDKCELCRHVFQFRPVYAENMPEQLSASLVVWTLIKKTIMEWSPLIARIFLSIFLWLGFVPLTTSWIYRIWIHRSRVLLPELFVERLTWNDIWNDCISGLIVVAAIMLSFLSLMSFADFLRFHWDFGEGEWGFADEFEQEIAGPIPANQVNNQPEQPQEENAFVEDDARAEEGEIDNAANGLPRVGNIQEQENDAQQQRQFIEMEEKEEYTLQGAVLVADGELKEAEEAGSNRNQAQDPQAPEPANQAPAAAVAPPPPPVPPLLPEHQPPAPEGPAVPQAPPQPAQPPPPAAAPVNVDLPGDLQADMEVNVALDELMGIRGPLTTLLRNVLWLLAFDGAYLGLFAFIPFSIGHSIYSVALRYLSNFGVLTWLIETCPEEWKETWGHLIAASTQAHQTLQLADLTIIFLGYVVMSTMVFTWRVILCAICQRIALQTLARVAWGIECVAAVVKVGVLLTLKMLLTPLMIGWCLDLATLRLFDATVADRIAFLGENLVGSLLLHWVTGITFMLFVTVSILQVREVCHPGVLAAHIRPQEPHPDLLGSLLRESAQVHARRMVLTLLIYATLLVLFVCLPVYAVSTLSPSMLPLKPVFYYFVPQLQIPGELVIFHLAMLASLENYKNKIGHLQHKWLKVVCRHLGLTRYLLPLPVVSRESQNGIGREEVGEVLVRPPPGWDDPVLGASQRWAWGDDPKSPIERSLATRQKPPYAFWRVCALLVLAWATILCLVFCIMLGPFVVGRSLFALCRLPLRFTHDPFTFALGIWLCWAAYGTYRSVHNIIVTNHLSAGGAMLSVRNLCKGANLKVQGNVLMATALWVFATPIFLGSLFEMLLVVSFETWSSSGVLGFDFLKNWILGLIMQHICFAHLLKLSSAPRTGDRNQEDGLSWQDQVKFTVQGFIKAAGTGDWSELDEGRKIRQLSSRMFCFVMWIFVKPTLFAIFFSLCHSSIFNTLNNLGIFWTPEIFLFIWKPSPVAQLVVFRVVLVWECIVQCSSHCESILNNFVKNVRAVVRDANFLIGLELQNHPETWKKATDLQQ